MDEGWKKLPLFVIILTFLNNAYGFKGGDYSNAHHQRGQPSDNILSPRAVQSSVSNVPVPGILSEEVGTSLFTNRPLKRSTPIYSNNLLQFVIGHDSSRHELMSHAQTTPSSSVVSLPLPLNEQHAGSLTSLQGFSGSTTTGTASVSAQGESTSFPAILGNSGLSTSDQSSPSSYQETTGAKPAEATLPVSSQENISYSSSSAPGATYASQGSPVELSEGSGQSISPQGEGGHSGLFHSQGTSSHYTPESYNNLSSSGSSQSSSDQSTPSLYSSSSHGSSGSLLEGEVAGLSSFVDLSTQSQETSSNLPASLEVSSQSTTSQSSPSLFMVESNHSDSHSTVPAYPLDTQGSLSLSVLSTWTQGSASTSQGSSGPELSGSSGPLISTQVQSDNCSGMSQSLSTSSRYAPGSLMDGKFGALPIGVSSQSASVQSSPGVSTSTQSRPGTQSTTSSRFFPVQGGSGSTSRLSLKPLGILGLYAPASLSKYANVYMSSHQAVYSQPTSRSEAWFGASTAFASQGMTTTYSGSDQPQGTTSQFAPGSPSSYRFVSLSSPQGAASQSATVQSSQKQFTSSYGTLSGSSTPFTLQGSTTYGGSLQPQGTTSRFPPGSQSYPSASHSSPQGAASQSASVQSSRKLFTSIFTGSSGTKEGSSTPFTLQGSTTYGGSLQPQGTTSRFPPGSQSYPSVSHSSRQGAASQSASVQSSRKLFTSTFTGSSGTKEGSSTPFTLQESTYGGSLQPQGTTSRFPPGSQSHPSVSHSSPQGAASESASVQSSRKLFTSIFTGSSGTKEGSSTPFTLQGSTTYGGSLQPQGTTSQFPPGSQSYPSVSHSSRQGAASRSASVQSSRKLFTSTFTGSSGTKEGSSTPFTLQESTTYGGSLQPQGTTSRFPPGSQSYQSVSLSSPQGAASQSATVQSSRKKFTSSSGTLSGSSTPFTLQGSTTYGGSLQPQGTTSQFVPASPSFYNCSCVSLSSQQDVASVSATVQTSQKQFTSTFTGSSGTQKGSFTPFNMQESTTYGGSLQPQATTSQFVPASPLSFSQGVASQPSQALQSYSVSQRWQPSQGIQTSGAATSQGSALSQSSPMQSRFSSLSSAGGSSSGYSGQFVSAQGGSTSDDFSLHSQSPSSKYTHTYPKLGSSLLTVSSQSTSDQSSNGLYISDSRRTQGLLAVVERPSRLSFQPPFDSPSSNQISKGFEALQRPTGSTLAPSSLGSSGQASSVSMFSGIPQNAQALRESGSNVQLYNRPFHRHYSVKG
ncbi:hornerin [Megalobrama amblycephala]|uniref:hornerin n=1 Tax=Megalobrama amblycephala TaxID=75352 RepID=UPI002013D4CF|nr:hornerin [Megalobrama amblycephala]